MFSIIRKQDQKLRQMNENCHQLEEEIRELRNIIKEKVDKIKAIEKTQICSKRKKVHLVKASEIKVRRVCSASTKENTSNTETRDCWK